MFMNEGAGGGSLLIGRHRILSATLRAQPLPRNGQKPSPKIWHQVTRLNCFIRAHQEANKERAQDGHEVFCRVRRFQKVNSLLQHQCEPNQAERADDLGNLATRSFRRAQKSITVPSSNLEI